jgi:hypothetical protein
VVDRSVELALRGEGVDAAALAAREEHVRSEMEAKVKACEGLRVSDKTMACVRAAQTSEELDQCLH